MDSAKRLVGIKAYANKGRSIYPDNETALQDRVELIQNSRWLLAHIETLEADNRALREALENLCDKLDAIEEATHGMFVMAHAHGNPYTGPNWKDEYHAAKAALNAHGASDE